jgi:rubrerythrin
MNLKNVKDLIKLAIEFEGKNRDLLKKILENISEDKNNFELVKSFENLIKEESQHVKNLKVFIK